MTEDIVNKYGLYSWTPEHGDKYIAQSNLDRFKKIHPLGKVFRCIGITGDYLRLKYGEDIFSVKPDLFKEIPDPGHFVGECVLVNTGSSKGNEAKIISMDWHHQRSDVMYTLEVDGKKKSNRYWKEDICSLDK